MAHNQGLRDDWEVESSFCVQRALREKLGMTWTMGQNWPLLERDMILARQEEKCEEGVSKKDKSLWRRIENDK